MNTVLFKNFPSRLVECTMKLTSYGNIIVSCARQAKKRFTRIGFSVCFFFFFLFNFYACRTTWIPLRRRAALRTRGTFIKRRYEVVVLQARSCFSVLTEFDEVQSLRQQYYMRLNECYFLGLSHQVVPGIKASEPLKFNICSDSGD